MPPETQYIPMLIEYGTMDSQTTKGSIKSIQLSILENQSHHYGCISPDDCKEIQRIYREMFYPSSPAWRTKIIQDTDVMMEKAVSRFMKLN
jgi:hypothetical protein